MKKILELTLIQQAIPNDNIYECIAFEEESPINNLSAINIDTKYYSFYFSIANTKEVVIREFEEFIKYFIQYKAENFSSWDGVTFEDIEFKITYKNCFLTKEFYSDPRITLDIFNELLATDSIYEKDMYADGTFLTTDVHDNQCTRHILSKVIKNFDDYIAFNKEYFVVTDNVPIPLSALQYLHEKYFGKMYEIGWDSEYQRFEILDNILHGIE